MGDFTNLNTTDGVQLPSTAAALLTIDTGKEGLLLELNGFNSGGAAVAVKFYRVPSGQTVTDARIFFSATLAGGEAYRWGGRIKLAASDMIYGYAATATAVSCMATYDQQ